MVKSVATLRPSPQRAGRRFNEPVILFYQHMIRHGQELPTILLETDGRTIKDGHHRYEACLREGKRTIPVTI